MNIISMQKYIPPTSYRQAGLSLVELMISLTIGLVLLVGVTSLIVAQSSSRNELDKSSRQVENGRYALETLRNDIEHAGFYSNYSPPSGSIKSIPDPCDITDNTANLGTTGNLGWINNSLATPTIPVPIFGYIGGATDPTTGCLPNYKPNTAVLVIRRTETATLAVAAANPLATYLQVSNCHTEITPFVLGTTGFTLKGKNCTTDEAPLRSYVVRIYYVSTCNICGAGGDTIPTLKVVEYMNGNQTTTAAVPIPLVEGIENMQLDYGIDYLPAATPDGSPDCYFSDPSNMTIAQAAVQVTACATATGVAGTWTNAATNWANVMAIRVNLLARNTECTAGHNDTKTYTLGLHPGLAPPHTACTNGAYKRNVYSELVRVTNTSGRRE